MPAPLATAAQLAALRRANLARIANPLRSRYSGKLPTLGHTLNDIAPGAGAPVLSAARGLHTFLDDADMAGGSALAAMGVPADWTAVEESIPVSSSGNLSTSQRATVHRLSSPIGRAAALGSLAAAALWAKRRLIDSPSQEDPVRQPGLTTKTSGSTVESSKIATAALVIDQQSRLIDELHSAHQSSVKTAAALVQAVKLAQDGAIDVSDIMSHAQALLHSGSVKVSAVGDIFDQSPGDLTATAGGTTEQGQEVLDPLTSFLRKV